MRVGTIIKDISPIELAGAVIDMNLEQTESYTLLQANTGLPLKDVSLQLVQKLDERNCIIWDSAYLHDKALQLIPLEDILPPSFESGPDLSYMNFSADKKSVVTEASATDKIVLPAIVFAGTFLLLTFFLALSSAGMGIIEIFKQFGILIILVSLVITIIISYFMIWKKG